MPELKKITSLSQQAKIIYETSIKLTEVFAGDALIVSEEKLKKGERLVSQFFQLCERITFRHGLSKNGSNEVYMKYETFQHV